MIRITVVEHTEEEAILKVEGWVSGEAVDLLAAEGNRFLQQVRRLVLDVTGVRFIDEAGIRLLESWAGERLVLQGASPFMRMLLGTHGLMEEMEAREGG